MPTLQVFIIGFAGFSLICWVSYSGGRQVIGVLVDAPSL